MDDEFIEAMLYPSPSDYADPGENPSTGVAPPDNRGKFRKWLTRKSREPQRVESWAQAMRVHDLKVSRNTLNLRRLYALALLSAMIVQVAIADILFWKYMQSYDYRVPEQSISVWLGATVVEIIGLIAIITKFLFGGDREGQTVDAARQV